MLDLAVVAGESGVSPELSRNGVTGALARTGEVRRPVDSASGSTEPDAETSGPRGGPVDAVHSVRPSTGFAVPGCPAPAGTEPSEG